MDDGWSKQELEAHWQKDGANADADRMYKHFQQERAKEQCQQYLAAAQETAAPKKTAKKTVSRGR